MQGITDQEADRRQAVLSYHLGVQQLQIGSYTEAMQRFHAATDALGESHLLWLRLAECAVELSCGTRAPCSKQIQSESDSHGMNGIEMRQQSQSKCNRQSKNGVSQDGEGEAHSKSNHEIDVRQPSNQKGSGSEDEREAQQSSSIDASARGSMQSDSGQTAVRQRSDSVNSGRTRATMCTPLDRPALLKSAVHSLEHASQLLSDRLRVCQSAETDQHEQLQQDLLQVSLSTLFLLRLLRYPF